MSARRKGATSGSSQAHVQWLRAAAPRRKAAPEKLSNLSPSPTSSNTFLHQEALYISEAQALHFFKRGQIRDQIVKLEYESDIIPAVSGQLSGIIRRNIFSVHCQRSACRGIHAA